MNARPTVTPQPSPTDAPITPTDRLSNRELDVLALYAQGLTYAQIARSLGIAIGTVDTHLRRVRAKTGARTGADLVRLGLGLADRPRADTAS